MCCSQKVEEEIRRHWGHVKYSDVEKPTEKININTGIYVFNPDIVNLIPKKKIDMPEVLLKLKRINRKIIIFPVHEEWSDLGLKKDFFATKKKFQRA